MHSFWQVLGLHFFRISIKSIENSLNYAVFYFFTILHFIPFLILYRKSLIKTPLVDIITPVPLTLPFLNQ